MRSSCDLHTADILRRLNCVPSRDMVQPPLLLVGEPADSTASTISKLLCTQDKHCNILPWTKTENDMDNVVGQLDAVQASRLMHDLCSSVRRVSRVVPNAQPPT